ncbi:MAG: hypothetical protein ACE5E1_00925 [Phycisphaerae bacterium]
MYTYKLRSSVFWGLVVCFILCGMVGCRATPAVRSLESPRSPARAVNTPAARPARKPAEATKDADKRRPSRWRRKLRAKYAATMAAAAARDARA